jgi:Family of unknown function (DUF6632)
MSLAAIRLRAELIGRIFNAQEQQAPRLRTRRLRRGLLPDLPAVDGVAIGLAWHEGMPSSNDYFMMIVGVYATLGVFMILASKNPAANKSLIWFVVWSSVVHAAVMAWEAVRNPAMGGHLIGDVPALLLIAIVLGYLMKRAPAS